MAPKGKSMNVGCKKTDCKNKKLREMIINSMYLFMILTVPLQTRGERKRERERKRKIAKSKCYIA